MALINSNYIFRTATVDDKDNVMEFLHNNWPGRWTKEILDYLYKNCVKEGSKDE